MCGAARFAVVNSADPQVGALDITTSATGISIAETRFWSDTPVLPIQTAQVGWQLCRWGNRNEISTLPTGGWAKQESLAAGKWAAYYPQPVVIPLVAGYEQGVWFAIATGVRGVMLAHATGNRVYMVTEAADEAYLQLTHHPRRPSLINQTDYPVLPGSRQQLGLW